jgi:hypothetical protein
VYFTSHTFVELLCLIAEIDLKLFLLSPLSTLLSPYGEEGHLCFTRKFVKAKTKSYGPKVLYLDSFKRDRWRSIV